MISSRLISIANQHPKLQIKQREIKRVVTALDSQAQRFLGGCPAGELSLVFMSDLALAQIHDDFLDDPTETDVITFEGDTALGTAGEICVSADRAAHYADSHHRNFSTELTLYLVHGWLHLAGYDDLEPTKKRRMRAAEARAISILNAEGIKPDFVLRK